MKVSSESPSNGVRLELMSHPRACCPAAMEGLGDAHQEGSVQGWCLDNRERDVVNNIIHQYQHHHHCHLPL